MTREICYTDIDETFRCYYRPLCLYALRYVHDTDEAEDIVQDCFMLLWERLSQGGVVLDVRQIRTDKLKGAATDAATVIVSGVGSLFGSGKMKKLEQSNAELHQEIAKRDTGIDDLKAQMRHMQEQHGRHIRNLQGIHKQELEAKDKEISRLNTLLEKAFKWFPMLREMLRMEKLCAAIGFTKEMIESLLTKKEAIRCNGRIYSEEHRRKFDIRNDIFKVEKNPTNDSKLVLTINRQPIGEWFKEQWEKLRQGLRKTEEPRKSRGFKL